MFRTRRCSQVEFRTASFRKLPVARFNPTIVWFMICCIGHKCIVIVIVKPSYESVPQYAEADTQKKYAQCIVYPQSTSTGTNGIRDGKTGSIRPVITDTDTGKMKHASAVARKTQLRSLTISKFQRIHVDKARRFSMLNWLALCRLLRNSNSLFRSDTLVKVTYDLTNPWKVNMFIIVIAAPKLLNQKRLLVLQKERRIRRILPFLDPMWKWW